MYWRKMVSWVYLREKTLNCSKSFVLSTFNERSIALINGTVSLFKLLLFFVAYLPELATDPNKKKYIELTRDTKSSFIF